MSTIVTRAGKGSALTHNEVDANFTNLNTDKLQSGNTASTLTITTATIDSATITGGTANGVAYLNGSKVLTTGSALTFDGSRIALGTATSNIQLTTTVNTNQAYISLADADGRTAVFRGPNSGAPNCTQIGSVTNHDVAFLYGNTEAMRLTSTGLGIGTSSPTTPLTVSKTGVDAGLGIFNIARIRDGSGNKGVSIGYLAGSNTTVFTSESTGAASSFGWEIYSGSAWSQAMTLDSSGNLGLGVTPSAWGSQWKALQINTGASIFGSSAFTIVGQNYVGQSTTDNYIANGFASRYLQSDGAHRWDTAPSGTGGAAITFTQAMTLDASGRLLVATTSSTGANTKFVVGNGLTSTNGVAVVNTGNQNVTGLFISNWDGTATTQGPRLGFDNSGRGSFIIGCSDGADNFDICQTWGTPRVRIDSSGNLLVGTTSDTTGRVSAIQSATTACFFGRQTNATAANGFQIQYSTAFNNTSNEAFYFSDGVVRATIRSNGGIANYQANDVNLSDRREKTNFAPAKSYLDTICAIPVQTFNYIDQNLEEDPGLTLGVVAQDVQAVAPELVMESNWGTKDEPKMRLSVYQTDLQYALMKCIQEQQAMIENMKTRLAAAGI